MSKHKVVRAKTGEDKSGKAFYSTIGRVIETSKGLMLKLDAVPVGWDGWAYINEPQDEQDKPARKPEPRQDDDDIPF
jgi:hypothetical protein